MIAVRISCRSVRPSKLDEQIDEIDAGNFRSPLDDFSAVASAA
jgi:hypothetical protein